MRSTHFSFIGMSLLIVTMAMLMSLTTGCSTTPKVEDQGKILADSQEAMEWFTSNVSGLGSQLASSAGYIVYPGVGQYGILISGGKFGRGVVYNSQGTQVGWAYLNAASAGLQVGGQGFKMLVVFENAATMQEFEQNKLTGDIGATVVAADAGKAGAASFTDGVAVYQGGQTGLMAGASIGMDYMRYEAVQ
ncbi:MAG: hypothetical protein MK116_12835 [Phycisphaerales bacterium]|nr:hypothetical protein [Phycisphaerales bacterium]